MNIWRRVGIIGKHNVTVFRNNMKCDEDQSSYTDNNKNKEISLK